MDIETKVSPTTDGEGAKTQPEVKGVQEENPTFDEILANKEYQSEFDKRVSKALETARAKWDGELEKTVGEKVAEANRLAKMTADEKAKFEKEKQEAEYKERLAAVTKRELKAEAKEQLVSAGMPPELAEVLVYTDADSCKASMDAVKKAFGMAVEKAVNEKLRGSAPGAGTQVPDMDKLSDDEYYKVTMKK